MTKQSFDWGFRPPQAGHHIDELVGLWRQARATAESMPACPCHGIISGVVDPDVMEHNMLSPLRARYRGEGQIELLAMVDQRLRKSPFAGKRVEFVRWLRGLGNVPLDEGARTMIYEDLRVALRFYAEGGVQFTCT